MIIGGVFFYEYGWNINNGAVSFFGFMMPIFGFILISDNK